jgi:hypothetical protein
LARRSRCGPPHVRGLRCHIDDRPKAARWGDRPRLRPAPPDGDRSLCSRSRPLGMALGGRRHDVTAELLNVDSAFEHESLPRGAAATRPVPLRVTGALVVGRLGVEIRAATGDHASEGSAMRCGGPNRTSLSGRLSRCRIRSCHPAAMALLPERGAQTQRSAGHGGDPGELPAAHHDVERALKPDTFLVGRAEVDSDRCLVRPCDLRTRARWGAKGPS